MRVGFKARLTLWHGTAVALILGLAALVGDRTLSQMVEDQVDAALLALAETEAASALDGPMGQIHLHEPRTEAGTPSLRRLDKLVQIVDAEGRVVDRSASLGTASLPSPPTLLARLREGAIVVETVPDVGGEPVRVVSLPLQVGGNFRYVVQVGTSFRPALAFLHSARLLFLGGSAAILAAVALIGAFLTKGALRPIDRIVAMARRIGESNLRQRLPHPGTADEVGRLAITLNEMLDRIERSIESQRRFTADASHEMRSPLSRLRSELEIALRRPRAPADYEAVVRSALEEVERLSRLTEELLILARLDAGERSEAPANPTPVTPLLEDELKRLEPQAEERRITITLEGTPGLSVDVAPDALRLVVANLLQNAVKFSPSGGQVTVRMLRQGTQCLLAVSDTGPGIPLEERERIFDRFYRECSSRSPDIPGVGLGLAISRAVVEAHGGTIAVDSLPGSGATFTVRLPLAA